MHKPFILFILLSCACYSQKNEQKNFCKSNNEASFFPFDNNTKKVVWRNTFYIERKKQIKNINGKSYIEFEQEYETDGKALRYFREEKGIIYEYGLGNEKETVRFDPKFKKGHCWTTANKKDKYKIISYDGELETPFCKYKNLLVIDAKITFGHFTFYYSRGLGYVGATQNEELISYVSSLQ
jgi:hypothetical protein